jgi:hypothetical protein
MTLCMRSVPGICAGQSTGSRVRQRIDKDVLAAAIPAVQGSYPSFSKWPPKFPQYSTRAKQALPKQILSSIRPVPLTFKVGRLYSEAFTYNTRHMSRRERTYEKASKVILVRL